MNTTIKLLDFDKVLEIRDKIMNVFELLEHNINKLKQIYKELLDNHNSKDYVFGLDSLHFQNSLIEIEYNNLKNIIKKIDNRIYCEYYNLYIIIIDYIKSNFNNIDELNKLCIKTQFPVYKHLEKDKLYNINLTKSIQKIIVVLLTKLNEILISKERELENDKKKSNLGLNIDNLINTEIFNNVILKGKIDMYKLYLETFNIHHMKYYTRLLLKCKLHMGIVNQDILLNNNNNNNNNNIDNELDISDNNILLNIDDEIKIKSFVEFDKETTNTKETLNSIISTISNNRSSSNLILENLEDCSSNIIIEQ